MPRKKSSAPSYRYHVSGQAVVTFCGQNFYLGSHDSPASWAKYHALCAEYIANGRTTPPAVDTHQADLPITVRCVTEEFRESIKDRPIEVTRYWPILTTLDDEYGPDPADTFGPRKLRELRSLFVASGNCRRYCNDQVRLIVRIFRYAVSRELIDLAIVTRLETLEPLKRGATTAKESKKRMPVSIDMVRASANELPPIIRAMVRIQVATAMRPGEVCRMRPCDIDRSGDVWFYRPEHHKTESHGVVKAVPIIGDARGALTPYLLRDATSYCFSPVESVAWKIENRRKNRTTPPHHGNRAGTNRKANPKSKPGLFYSKDGYRQAIHRACDRAGVERWTPYQLRHLTATAVREALDIDAAKHLLGHTNSGMTENYAKVSEAKAIAAARVAPSVG